MQKAYSAYFAAAKSGQFPKPELSFQMREGEFGKFLEQVG